MDIPALGIAFSIISMVTLGLAIAMAKTPALTIGTRRFAFWRQASTSSLLFLALLFFRQSLAFPVAYFMFALVISMTTYFALVSCYQALKIAKIGVISPITNSSLIITILFSVVFLGESLAASQIAAISLVVFGIIALSVNFHDFKNSGIFKISSGIPLALVACLIWGIAYALYKIPIAAIGPLLAAFAIEFGTFLPNIPANLITKTSFALPDKKTSSWILIIGLLAATSTLFYNLAIQASGNVSLVAAITFSNPIISTLYGYFVYKEKLALKEFFALAIMVAGIIGISIT